MPDLVLVPSPLRRSRSARRLCDAQGGLLLGPRVSTIRSLVPGLLAGAGESRTLLTPLAERILAQGAAAEARLAGPEHRGGARAAAELVAEVRRGEVSAAEARQAAATAPGRAGERLRAAAAALESYEERLDGLGVLDHPAALRAAVAALHRGATSQETAGLGLLVLEGFIPPWPAALDLVGALAERARRVVARVPYLPGDPRRSAPAEPWVRRVESWHELSARRDVALVFPGEGRAPAIARALGVGGGDAGLGRVVSLPAPGDREQAEAAARFAADLLEAGFAPDDIALVAPRRIWDDLASAFDDLAVALAAPLETPLSASAPYRHVRAALEAAGDLGRGAAETLLASPYLRLAGEPPPGLSRLLDRAGAIEGRGDPESRLRERARRLAPGPGTRREREELASAARVVGQLRLALAPLATAATPRHWAARLRGLLDRAGARRRAARGEPDLARRDLAALNRMDDLLDELAEALAMAGRGAEPVEPAEWLALLDLASGAAVVPASPGPAAAAVELWPPEEAPGLGARAVVVLGAERGSWPPAPRTDPVLGDAARAAVNDRLGRRALATAAARQAEAEFLGLSALAAAQEVLAVGFTRGPGGEGAAPLAAEVLARAGACELPLAADPPLARARGVAEALRASARRFGAGRAGADLLVAGEAAAAGLEARARSAAARGALETERRDACADGRATPGSGALPADLAGEWAAALPAQWSATQLETHARCPYRFFLQVVGLPDADAADLDISPRDEGRLLHATLEALLAARRARGAWPPGGGDGDRAEIRRVAEAVFDRFEAEGRVGDPEVFRARRPSLLRRLERWVEAEARVHDGLAPVLLEHEFGGASASPPLALPGPDGPILLRGRVDRVDADGRRLRVIDYKNSRNAGEHRRRLEADELGRTSFQPPLYLLAAARELPGRSEYEFTYGLLRSGERVEPWRAGPQDPFLATAAPAGGEAASPPARTFAAAVGVAVARIRSGTLPVAPADCSGCPFGAVCRFPRPGGEA